VNARLPLLLALALPAAAADGFQLSGSAELRGSGTAVDRVADLPTPQWTAEARSELRLKREAVEAVLRPILFEQHNPERFADVDQAYLSQAYARIRLGGGLTFTGGRELLTWGPANFRSPSNPLYFDAARTDPLREVPGVDLARVTWTRGPVTAMAARELDAGRLDRDGTPRPVSLAKLDLRARDSLASVIVANQVWGAPFFGGFAQPSLGEAWLVYAEIGSGRSARDPSRKTTSLLGATYTLVSGQTLGLEWLRDGHGQAQPAPLPGGAPGGRDHTALLWQSNLQESGRYWRLQWTANLRDHGSQLLAYGEKSLSPRITAFASWTRNLGGAASEYGGAFRAALTLGVKCFVY
jgi:hypothetical protein